MILTVNIGNCQNFDFLWQIWPSFSNSYTVKIIQENNKRTITIMESNSNDSIVKKFKKSDIDILISFLDTYDYPIKGSHIIGPITKEYHETILLPDTNWLVVSGDSIRKDFLHARGYIFDTDLNKCYNEIQAHISWTDGCTYKGHLKTFENYKKFDVYSARLSTKDYHLNQLIYKFITSYDKDTSYDRLKFQIDVDKPRNKY